MNEHTGKKRVGLETHGRDVGVLAPHAPTRGRGSITKGWCYFSTSKGFSHYPSRYRILFVLFATRVTKLTGMIRCNKLGRINYIFYLEYS